MFVLVYYAYVGLIKEIDFMLMGAWVGYQLYLIIL